MSDIVERLTKPDVMWDGPDRQTAVGIRNRTPLEIEAAGEIERLRKLAADLAEQWEACEADRNPNDFREFGPCQLMQEGLALRKT